MTCAHGAGAHICNFADGVYRARSPSGKTSLLFEVSRYFGPSRIDPRTGDLTPISNRVAWFWHRYSRWLEAGRPVVGDPVPSKVGDVHAADFACVEPDLQMWLSDRDPPGARELTITVTDGPAERELL